MSGDAWLFALAWAVTSLIMLFAVNRMERNIGKEREAIQHERAAWAQERKQLMDRIQAGSFAEYKTAEIRTLKAQQPEKETVHLEPQ